MIRNVHVMFLKQSSDSEDEIETVLAFVTRQTEQDMVQRAAVTPEEGPTTTQDMDDWNSQVYSTFLQADEIREADNHRPSSRTV